MVKQEIITPCEGVVPSSSLGVGIMDDENSESGSGKYLKFTGVFSTSKINKNGNSFQSCEFSGGNEAYQFKFPEKDLTHWQLNPKWCNCN